MFYMDLSGNNLGIVVVIVYRYMLVLDVFGCC